jgi:hypothetical protein
MYPNMYNMMSKTLNAGDVDSLGTLQAPNFEMFTLNEFDPFAPIDYTNLNSYDEGAYVNGVRSSTPPLTLDGGTYTNGVLNPPPGLPINGGVYS